ncbi:hypothetical protein Bca52824_011305 [Brassica carinata]|uniref:Uncharacterized protein n=1 Tax=Brassica carinata TaxID=52824 RepID=A0A8X7WG14_BRACI|nr:hypothetical protein Bca52824_011305 [Brassica carinata]
MRGTGRMDKSMCGLKVVGRVTRALSECLDQHSECAVGYARDEHPAREETACSRSRTRSLECAGWMHRAGSKHHGRPNAGVYMLGQTTRWIESDKTAFNAERTRGLGRDGFGLTWPDKTDGRARSSSPAHGELDRHRDARPITLGFTYPRGTGQAKNTRTRWLGRAGELTRARKDTNRTAGCAAG